MQVAFKYKTLHVHLQIYVVSFKLQAHSEPDFERRFTKEKRSENTAISDAAKIGSPNNHLGRNLYLCSV